MNNPPLLHRTTGKTKLKTLIGIIVAVASLGAVLVFFICDRLARFWGR